MNLNFKKYLLEVTNSKDCFETEIIQPLWSGYGKISRIKLEGSNLATVVVKCISPNNSGQHPRGWDTDFSHQRKIKSYQVETHWYEKWSKFCADKARVPAFIGSFSESTDQWIVLEDLNAGFPLRKQELNFNEVKVCLKWLANFHATFLNKKPQGLWEVGTYWHLATRPDEFKKIDHPELREKAHLIDEILNNCNYMTIVHGDAKLANFCFSEDEKSVAVVDFQYVGGGCGMKDVAYFLGSCLSGAECELYENELLDFYFSKLQNSLHDSTISLDFTALEVEWRRMYPIACADFSRFLMGWMPTHQKLNDYNLKMMQQVLKSF